MRHRITRLFRSRRTRWTFALLAFVVLGGGVIARLSMSRPVHPPVAAMRYSELMAALRAGQVDSLVVHPGSAVLGWMRATDAQPASRAFRVEYGNRDPDPIVAEATTRGVGVAFAPKSPDRSNAVSLIFTLVVTIGVGVLIYVSVTKQSGSGQMETIEIHNTRGIAARTTFADVAGNAAAIADLQEVVEFLRNPKSFAAMGAKVPKGILLEGPPGTGKTLMARALAGEAGSNFFAMSGPDFSGMFVGVGTMRVKHLFRKARRAGGGVIFVDEIDSLGGKRGRHGGHAEDDRTLNQFLVEMDGFGPSEGIIVIAATNRASELDGALLRKGRFDRAVTVGLPSVDERQAILSLHVAKRGMPLAGNVELSRLARLMPGTSGADLEGLLNEAAILAVRTGAQEIDWSHVEEARDRVLLGRAREGFAVSTVERRLVALHEAGHAIAGLEFCPQDPLHKVTIQPRGGAMGVAFFQPDHEAHLHSRTYLEGQIRKALGGRAAEALVFGDDHITSGAGSDLQQSTRIAKQMVYRLGMGRQTGLVIFDPDSGPVSGDLHARMDNDVREIIDAAYEEVFNLLQRRRRELEALAEALLDRETLTGVESEAVMAAAAATPDVHIAA